MNVKKLTSFALIALSATFTFAQQKQAYSPHPSHMVRNRGLVSTVDSTHLRVWYALNADSIADMNTYIDFQRLDVGDSISKYYSWFVYNSDSLLRDWHKKHPKARSIPKWLGPGGKKKDTWIQYEFSELYMQNGMLTEYEHYWLRTSALNIGLPAMHLLPATRKRVLLHSGFPLRGSWHNEVVTDEV